MVTYIENVPIPEPLEKKFRLLWKTPDFLDLFCSSQEMLLSNLKPVATLQYQPEGPHVLFYMTTTKANLVWEQEHTHARQA